MCLEKITKVYKPSLFNLWMPKYKNGVGWKSFELWVRGLRPYYYNDSKKDLVLNEFMDEKEYRNRNILNEYRYGWHIFLEKPDCWMPSDSVVRKVEYKEGHTIGVQGTYGSIIVAKYMKILEE